AECFLVGHHEAFKESVRRLQAYAEAGADVLYAPGIQDYSGIQRLIQELPNKPLNILMSRNNGLRLSDLAQLGVRRVSVGSSLARAAWTGFIRAAHISSQEGSFAGFDNTVSYSDLNTLFKDWA